MTPVIVADITKGRPAIAQQQQALGTDRETKGESVQRAGGELRAYVFAGGGRLVGWRRRWPRARILAA